MSARLNMRRVGDALIPVANAFLEELRTIPQGKEVIVNVLMARNPRQDRWFHAMLGEVVKAGAWDGDKESLKKWLKFATGLVDIMTVGEKVYEWPRSTSEASMDKIAFQRWIKRVDYVLLTEKGIDIQELRKRTAESAGLTYEQIFEPDSKPEPEPAPEPKKPAEPKPERDEASVDLLKRFHDVLKSMKAKRAIENTWWTVFEPEFKAHSEETRNFAKAIMDSHLSRVERGLSANAADGQARRAIDRAAAASDLFGEEKKERKNVDERRTRSESEERR